MSVVTFILVNDFHLTVNWIPCYSEPNSFTGDTYFVLQIGPAHTFLRATFLPHPPASSTYATLLDIFASWILTGQTLGRNIYL